MKAFHIYAKSFLTGLATLSAAVFLAAAVIIAKVWMSSDGFFSGVVDSRQVAGVLVASFLVFASGFSWQYLRLRGRFPSHFR